MICNFEIGKPRRKSSCLQLPRDCSSSTFFTSGCPAGHTLKPFGAVGPGRAVFLTGTVAVFTCSELVNVAMGMIARDNKARDELESDRM